MRQSFDIVIVGGGLAGLTAAAILARAGQQVRLLERGPSVGGRAATHQEGEFLFNLGLHSYYLGGPAERILRDLGIVLTGSSWKPAGAAIFRDKVVSMPLNHINIVNAGFFTIPARSELLQFMVRLPNLDPIAWYGETVRTWVEREVWQSESRALLYSLVRVATLINAPEQLSAGVAIQQIHRLMKTNVRQIDDGWGSLVESLRITASVAGARIECDRNVARIEREGDGWVLDWGPETAIEARTVLLAVPPQAASSMLVEPAGKPLAKWSREAQPVLAAALDLGLASLPMPRYSFLWGLDQPFFFANVATLAQHVAPGYMSLMQGLYYIHPGMADTGKGLEATLEKALDLAQPGWRDRVEARRFLPRLTVMHSLPRAHRDGLAARPGPAVPDNPGLYVAGDWVGPVGLLAEASIASAAQAAELILEQRV